MEYSKDLEQRLGVTELMDKLEVEFSSVYPYKYSTRPLEVLRKVKVFLHQYWNERRTLFRGSVLDSTDCLTIAILANTLASRRWVKTRIARPRKLTRYYHAILIYESKKGEEIFKVSGRYKKYDWIVLTPHEVEFRLRYIKPILDLANFLRCNNVPAYQENRV